MYTRCDNAAFANFVAAISRTNSNWFEFVRLIVATKFCRSDNDFHEINRVTQGDLLRRLVPATCRSDLSPSVSRPLHPHTLLGKVIEKEHGFMKLVTKFGIIDTWIAPNRLQITDDMNVSLDTTKTIRLTAACKKALDQ